MCQSLAEAPTRLGEMRRRWFSQPLLTLPITYRQPEGYQEPDKGPDWVNLAAECRELGRGRTGVMVVVQFLPKGDEREEPEISRVVLELLGAE